MEWSEPISPYSLVDQINDEGAAFGLCADFDEEMGRVFVCETEPQTEVCFGFGDCSRAAPGRRLCSVDDEHPFSAVHGNRIFAGEDNPLERYHRFDAMMAKKRQEKSDGTREEFISVQSLKLRGGARYWAGMNTDLATNRRARRIREALRRAGGGP